LSIYMGLFMIWTSVWTKLRKLNIKSMQDEQRYHPLLRSQCTSIQSKPQEAEKAAHEAMQFAQAPQPTAVSIMEGIETTHDPISAKGDTETDPHAESGIKRKAEEGPAESHKKARTGVFVYCYHSLACL
jgi:hypothetical protein